MKLFLNQCFDKTRLRNLIAWVLFTKGEKETIEIVEKLKSLGFQFATRAGISLSIDDLKIPLEKVPLVSQAKQQVALATSEYEKGNVTTIEKLQQLVDTWHRTSETLKQTVVSNFQATDKLSPVYMMAFSGARGNISQVRQLAGMRGLMADPQGQIIGFPIRSNFREGLTLTEYMISCYGARKGLVDTALRTADAGYLTRRLVDVSQHMVVKASTCGTRRGIVLYDLAISGKSALSLRDRLVGRVLAEDVCEGPCTASPLQKCIGERNQEISANLASQIASLKKKVSVRSPLTCSIRHGVCQLCYGWSLSEGRVVNLGEAVGIIAAQSIGEPGTQLTMRTFHTGGVFSGDVLTEIRAPYEGIAHFTNPLQGLLIRTSHGKIAFLTKASGELVIQGNGLSDGLSYAQVAVPPKETIFRLEASTVIFVRQHEKVSRTQLIAEFSSEINETIEAKRTLFANSAGQISFASSLIGGRLRGNGDIVQFSRDLGFVWILSGKESAPLTLLDLFQKGAHIVNQNTIIARVPTFNPDTFWGFDSRAPGRALFLPSILYSWIRLKNRESLSIGQPRPTSDESKSHLFTFYEKCQETSRFAAKPIQKNAYQSGGVGGGLPNVSYYPAQTNRGDPVLGLGEMSKNGISKNLFTLSHYITLGDQRSKVKVKGHLFKGGDNTLVWIFPDKYKTTRNGLAWFDSRYLNRELSLGELIWIETEPYTASINPHKNVWSGRKEEEDQKQSSLLHFYKKCRGFTNPSSMYSTRVQKCELFLTFRNRAHPTNEMSQSFSKEKGSNDHFSKKMLTKKVQRRGFTNRGLKKNVKKWGLVAGSNVVGEGRESSLLRSVSLLPHSVMWQGKEVSGSGSCWVYCPQEREKVSTLHESINFYRNRQFDKLTFDSSLVYIKGWFSEELVYSVKNNLVSKLSMGEVRRGIGDVSSSSPETRQSDCRLPVDLTSSLPFPVRRRAVNRQDNDGLHFAGPTDDAPDDKKSRVGLLFLRKWMQIPQRYARTVPLHFSKGVELSELDSRTGTQNCFQARGFDSRKNVSTRRALEAVALAERYKFLVWKNLMNCKPFLLLRTCPFQVQVISNTKGRHFLPISVEHPLTWRHLVDSRGPYIFKDLKKNVRSPSVWQGAVQKGRKPSLHQFNLRQQIRLAPLSEKGENFFNSLLQEGPLSYQDVTAHKGISWPYSPSANLFTVISKGCSMPLPKVNDKGKSDDEGTGFRNALQRGTTCQEGQGGREAVRGEADSSRTSTFRFSTKVRRRLLVTDRKPKKCKGATDRWHLSLVSLLLANDFCTKLVSNDSYLLRFLGIPLTSPKALTLQGQEGTSLRPFNVSNVKTPATGELVGIQGPKPSPPYLLTEGDQISMSLFSHKIKGPPMVAFVGQFITLGEEFVPEYAATASGQVVAIEENKITFRRTQPFLFYANGITHVNHRQWVNKNAPILTLTYQKLVTGDIVQGIPKIEQFFEAPATREGEPLPNSLQSRLRKTYHRLRNSLPQIQAVKHSLEEIQQVLVEGILRVYLSQGVRIADKHLEVVIRQMTSKGQILDVGNTGLFQGEFVNLDRIERINLGTYGQKADYEPSVLGITQASLGAESFISAASFQETTRVLSRDTIVGKTDFLRGLKERVVLGDVIQAGTGLDDNINYGLLFGV